MLESLLANLPSNILIDVIVMIIIATAIAFLTNMIRQPLIPAYVLTGILIGPGVIGFVKNYDSIYTLSEIGIAFLLFIVGLEMDFKRIKEVGWVASIGGLIQVIATFFLGYFVSSSFGLGYMNSIYIGLIVAFSSTMIVVKLFSDRDELQTLHGRISLGILVMQDLIVVFVLAVLPEMNNFSYTAIWGVLLKAVMFLLICFIALKYILPGIFKQAAKNRELLFLASITTCFLFAIIALELGFSIVIGAFLGGLMLGNLPYYIEVARMVKPLRDFFGTLFFVALGMQLRLSSLSGLIKPLLYLLLIVLVLKPFIVFLINMIFGYEKKTSFLAALSLAQISEFSLVLVALGLSLNQISQDMLSLTVLLAVVTITLTSYLIRYENILYNFLSKFLTLFERISLKKRNNLHYIKEKKYDVVFFGARRIAPMLIEKLRLKRTHFLIVDYDPEIIKKYVNEKIPCIYGDMSNEDLLKKAKIGKAKMVISTVLTKEDNSFLIRHVKEINKKAIVIVTAATVRTALEMYEKGADYVILPQILSGEFIANNIFRTKPDAGRINKLKERHIRHLLQMHNR